jgi:hypothetical protein
MLFKEKLTRIAGKGYSKCTRDYSMIKSLYRTAREHGRYDLFWIFLIAILK